MKKIPRRQFLRQASTGIAASILPVGLLDQAHAMGARSSVSAESITLKEDPMVLTLEQMMNGLTPEHDYFFAEKPDNPDMRESTSVWLYEENGEFGFPRMGIEGEAHSWDDRLYHANFAFANGRVLHSTGRGAVPSPVGADGKPSVFGAGPLEFRCIEPFRRWYMRFDGLAYDGTLDEQIANTLHDKEQVPVKLEVELTMETPAWVQDNSPEKVAKMTPEEKADAESMGVGWRLEHLCRGEGQLTLDGGTRPFKMMGSRIKRQSVRPMGGFRGHCWQSAIFPDGRAFGTIAYPATAEAPAFNQAYVYQNGVMYPARATRIPYIRRVVGEGEDVSLELESELGIHRIAGRSTLNTFRVNNPDFAALGLPGFTLQQGGARYTWDGMTSLGMLERSALGAQMAGE